MTRSAHGPAVGHYGRHQRVDTTFTNANNFVAFTFTNCRIIIVITAVIYCISERLRVFSPLGRVEEGGGREREKREKE